MNSIKKYMNVFFNIAFFEFYIILNILIKHV